MKLNNNSQIAVRKKWNCGEEIMTIADFLLWPHVDNDHSAARSDWKLTTGTEERGANRDNRVDRPSLNFDKASDFIGDMHESAHKKTSPSRFFIASPDVCGEAASLSARQADIEERDWKQSS